MNQENPMVIVGVRFSKIGKNYYFNASHVPDIQVGQQIVVETSRGWQMGEVTEITDKLSPELKQNIKKIDRRATENDLAKKQELSKKEEEAFSKCLHLQRKMNFRDIKLVTAEIGFDEKSLSILYSSPEDEEIKGLDHFQKAIREEFPRMRIDLHKIGPRDVAKYFGGLGACGMEVRCCTRFLCEFQSISIKMAKIQNISLTPSDITGMCDRLRCCLNYEFCQYEEILKGLPRRNQRVMTPEGEGRVVDLIPLQEKVVVQIGEESEKTFENSQVEKIEGDMDTNKPRQEPSKQNINLSGRKRKQNFHRK
jgi:cell fate regulator YaaT (PSP1 superfamily)